MACPTLELIHLIGKKWTFVLLQEVSLIGNEGFNAMYRRMKINPKLLAQRLRQLESEGIITRKLMPRPFKGKYSMTVKGTELLSILNNLRTWNARHSNITCVAECTSCPQYQQSF